MKIKYFKLLILGILIISISISTTFVYNLNIMVKEGRILDIELNNTFKKIYKKNKWVLNKKECDSIRVEYTEETKFKDTIKFLIISIDTSKDYSENVCYLLDYSKKYKSIDEKSNEELNDIMKKYQDYAKRLNK